MNHQFYIFFHIYADGNNINEAFSDFIPVFKQIIPIKLFIGIVGNLENRNRIKNILNENKINYSVANESDVGWEQLTLDKMYEFSLENNGYVFYCHTKGSSSGEEIAFYWRRAMIYYNLYDLDNIFNLLKTHQAVGCYLKEKWKCLCQKNHIDHTFFGGNFWWTSLNIIRELDYTEKEHRHCAEHYLGEILKKYSYSFYDLRRDQEIGENREFFNNLEFKMKTKKSLVQIQNELNFDTDKNSGHSYLETYDELFENLDNPSFLEIGIWTGGSLSLWKEYTNNTVHGIDINPQAEASYIFKADVKFWTPSQNYDIIIDDGSHILDDMLIAYDRLRNFYNKYYIIEDIQDENQLNAFKALNPWKIFDLRDKKNRYDDILIVFKK